ncbi:MAG: hypothetical protein RQ723_08025 [Desulfuromonadales bacterium]|nr:hypothetical protein [Desulfuromonadales bacterium]
MTRNLHLFAVATLLTALLAAQPAWTAPVAATTGPAPQVEVLAIHPPAGTPLAFAERAYLRLGYHSSGPLRFQLRALRSGELHEIGFSASRPTLHVSGDEEALAWLAFDNVSHIDELRIDILDVQWQRLATLSVPTDLVWLEAAVRQATPRPPAAWVTELERIERRKKDYFFDPAPRRHGTLSDAMFLITVAAAPLYILLQVQMLRLYRRRWRELAMVPLLAAVPLVPFALIVGFDYDIELWLAFLFRATPYALLYLLTLWTVKWIRGTPPAKPRQPGS